MSYNNFTYVNGADSGVGEYFVPNDTVSIVKGTRTGSPDGYDAVGAMKFIIATVVFYSIFGVLCALSSRIIKRRKHRTDMKQDENIARFLKLERKLKLDGYKMRLMFEIRQWRQKYSRDKDKLARTKSINSENYDIERTLEELEKRHQLNLCQIGEENEISEINNLKDPESDESKSSNRQVEQGSAFLLDPTGEVGYSDHFQNQSSQMTEHLSVGSPPKGETGFDNLKNRSTHRSGDGIEVEADPKYMQSTSVEIENLLQYSVQSV